MNTGNESKRIVRTLRRVKTKQQIVISKIEHKKQGVRTLKHFCKSKGSIIRITKKIKK